MQFIRAALRVGGFSIWFFCLTALYLSQVALGVMGLDYLGGPWAAIAGIAAAMLLSFSIPLTVGTYFGVVYVLDWPWWAGILIAAPGIALLAPAFLLSILGQGRWRF